MELKEQLPTLKGHEAGHSAGLDHPWENRDEVSDINQNSKDVLPKTIKSNLLKLGSKS